ncbi:MAG: nicotinate-nucleotide adenylyltransferase [Candidatus Omnitrophica bacterium]|nr:nicotinate-nucleotide adenylyltransferase [Candidatus Omnitrophota bacterium]
MKIGLLGGTFNPIHTGHLILAQECWSQLVLDKVIFVPAFMPPHKQMEKDVSAADRLNMLRMALEEDDRFEISTYEVDKEGVSYSIDTVRYMKKKYPDGDIFFLTGADSAESLSMWKEIEALLEESTFVIASRPGWGDNSPYEKKIKRIIIPSIEISSSDIRQRIGQRSPIDYLTPRQVVRYIRNKGLYR